MRLEYGGDEVVDLLRAAACRVACTRPWLENEIETRVRRRKKRSRRARASDSRLTTTAQRPLDENPTAALMPICRRRPMSPVRPPSWPRGPS